MPDRNDETGVFKRFDRRCAVRTDEILSVVASCNLTDSGVQDTLRTVGLQIHDWVGETKLLGFDKLSAALLDLDSVVKSWRAGSGLLMKAKLLSWVRRLTDISRRFALEAPDRRLQGELHDLRAELRHELEIAGVHSDFSEAPSEPPPGPDAKRILILDDSPIVGQVLSVELESRGHQVAVTATLAEFSQRLKDFAPEVIFLDVNMPEMQGDEVCLRLRRRFIEHIPIIIFSSLPDDELAILAERAGADGFLSKQRGIEDLFDYLDDLLSQVIF